MSGFVENMREKQKFVNEVINGLSFDIHSLLEAPAKYSLVTGGKRLRPILCMLCAEMVGGDYREAKNAFLALELIHNGTLVHDDIIDNDHFRRGNLSVHIKFDGKRAVLTGDALLSLGLKYATKTGNLKIVGWLSETALKMVQGVALQTYYRRRIASAKEYLNIAYLKSGSLFEAAAALGGLVSNENEAVIKRLADFGRFFGIAYQIRDDICGIFHNDDTDLSRSDLLNGDLTLPFIYALEANSISDQDKKNLVDIFLGGKEDIDEEKVQRIYMETGAIDESMERMRYYAEQGNYLLSLFEESRARECIQFLFHQYYKDFNPRAKLEIII